MVYNFLYAFEFVRYNLEFLFGDISGNICGTMFENIYYSIYLTVIDIMLSITFENI